MNKYNIIATNKLFLIAFVLYAIVIHGCRNNLNDNESFQLPGNSSISGTITHTTSPSLRSKGIPIQNAKVWIERYPDLFALTNADGKYVIQHVPPGSYKIVAKYTQNSIVFKIRSAAFGVKSNTNSNVDLIPKQAKNKVKGTMKNENGSAITPGTKLHLWGEEFKMNADGTFETPPLPDFEDIDDALNTIIVNFGLPYQISLPIAFGNGSQTQTVELLIPETPARINILPRVSLINITDRTNIDGVYPNSHSNLRAIFFPESPEKIEWSATKGVLGPNININGTMIAKTWTSPDEAGIATISISVSNSGKTVTSSLTIMIKGTQHYSITYLGNGNTSGIIPTDTAKYIEGDFGTVKDNLNTLEKSGFIFSNWNTKADGTGTTYTPGLKLQVEKADIYLYAQWTAKDTKTYSVNYNGNSNTSGEAPIDSQKYQPNNSATIKDNSGNLSRTDFIFSGWNTLADGTGKNYTAGESVKINSESITLYARWIIETTTTYSIAYNGNENTVGTVPIDAQKYVASSTVTVKSNSGNLARTGFTFTGWNTKANGSGTNYSSESSFLIASSNVTLYANWVPKVTVVFNNNTGNTTANPESLTVNNGDKITNLPKAPSKIGHEFITWNTKANGSGSEFTTDSVITNNITVYAQYNIHQYTVSYAAEQNGSITGSNTQTVGYNLNGCSVTANANLGYKFTSWSDGKTENPRTDINVKANIDVKASFVSINAEVKANNKFAYSENAGWINFSSTQGKVVATLGTNGFLSNFAWSENIGWIKFASSNTPPFANTTPNNWGVNIANNGNLSGFAWSENSGWINFGTPNANAVINLQTGELSGYAWSENIGWIKLSGSVYKVQFEL